MKNVSNYLIRSGRHVNGLFQKLCIKFPRPLKKCFFFNPKIPNGADNAEEKGYIFNLQIMYVYYLSTHCNTVQIW